MENSTKSFTAVYSEQIHNGMTKEQFEKMEEMTKKTSPDNSVSQAVSEFIGQ